MRDTRRIERRPGFVLLTVTLVGALLFISALMFVSQLTTESHVTKTDAYFKSALNLAETGLTNVLMDINSNEGWPQWAEWLQNDSIPLSFDAVPSSAVHGTYEVSADLIGTRVSNPLIANSYSAEVQITSEGRLYTPAVTVMVSSGGVSSGAYAARRAVRTNVIVMWTDLPPFEVIYGIFTGGNLNITGSAQEVDGDIFANGNVYIKKASGLVDGEAYAAGTVTGGIPSGDKFPGQTPIPFPEIDIEEYRKLFDAYLRGTYPYNGAVDGMTNTSFTPLGLIQRAFFNVDKLVAAASTDPVTGLYELPSMEPITADVCSALIDPTAVYYFDGDVKLASNNSLSGTIVIDGTFFISGNVDAGTNETLVSIIATGDVVKDTGCSNIYGLIYTGGEYTGTGSADVVGAIVVRESLELTGDFKITYDDRVSPILIEGNGGHAVERPASGDRMWQEVTDLLD